MATAVVEIKDLAPGSRILKTSRVRESIGGHIYDLDTLAQEPAWELFCWHAFAGEKPPEDLAESAEKAAGRCGGLPLALKVLGSQVAEAEDKRECLTTFVDLPRASNAMIDCRIVVKKSYENLPAEPLGLRDVFVLVAGVWPRRQREFMERQRAVENLGVAVYGDSPRSDRCRLARKAVDKLISLSLLGLRSNNDDEPSTKLYFLTVHDLIFDVAEILVADTNKQLFKRFYRQPPGDNKLTLSPNSRSLEHVSLYSGSTSVQGIEATCSLILGPGTSLDDDGPQPM